MPRWTAESRQKQREKIRQWKPWERSTGPKTPEGKQAVARNRTGGRDFIDLGGIGGIGLIRIDTRGGREIEDAIANRLLEVVACHKIYRRNPIWLDELLRKNGYCPEYAITEKFE